MGEVSRVVEERERDKMCLGVEGEVVREVRALEGEEASLRRLSRRCRAQPLLARLEEEDGTGTRGLVFLSGGIDSVDRFSLYRLLSAVVIVDTIAYNTLFFSVFHSFPTPKEHLIAAHGIPQQCPPSPM